MSVTSSIPSTAGIESRFICMVFKLPVWKLAIRADSSGMWCQTISANSGVLRQWSSTAFHLVNWSPLCSMNSQDDVAEIFLLADSTPTSAICFLLPIFTCTNAIKPNVSYWGVTVFTSIVYLSTILVRPSSITPVISLPSCMSPPMPHILLMWAL